MGISTKYMRHDYVYHTSRMPSKEPLYLPFAFGIIVDPITDEEVGFPDKFLIDTGASISILGPKYSAFLGKQNPVDEVMVQYGDKRRTLQVYFLVIRIKGEDYPGSFAYDPDLKLEYQLLGHHNWLDKFAVLRFDQRHHVTRLLRYRNDPL